MIIAKMSTATGLFTESKLRRDVSTSDNNIVALNNNINNHTKYNIIIIVIHHMDGSSCFSLDVHAIKIWNESANKLCNH